MYYSVFQNQASKIVKFERAAKKIRSLHSEPDSHLTKNQKKIKIVSAEAAFILLNANLLSYFLGYVSS